MKKIYVFLFLFAIISFLNSPIFSQSPACANFSGVFISDSLEQNLQEYYICSGSNIYLKSLNNPVGATFQWKKNGVNISGETTRKINVTSEGLYSLTMTVGTCTATSSGIIVRQYSSGGYHPYQISSNNISQACTGDSITLSVPKGFGITYQWKKDNVNIINSNTSTHKAIATGNYSLVATQGTCSFTSNSVSLNFSNSANPQITSNKNVICEGKTTSLKSSNVNVTHTLQWFKDGVAISSANKDSLVVSQTGNYYLQTTKGTCTGNSNAMNISITNLNLPAPQIQKDYSNAFETCANNVVKLKVKDYNDGDLTWLKDGNVLAGQTGTTLIARESGNYAVRYSGNELCFSQSAVVPVKITDLATMSFVGNNFTVGSGQQAKINYSFNGVAPIVLNVNNQYNTLILNPSGINIYNYPTSTTTYSATNFANACGVGTFSNPATITLGTCSPATQITSISATNATVCIGGSTTINISANGTNYQWQKDGVDISGATSSSLNISNFNYTNIGDYKLKVTGTCGTITSDNIRINANYGDVVFAKLAFPAYLSSEIPLRAFSGSSSGNSSNAYSWTGPNNFASAIQNPTIVNSTSANNGVYTVNATNVNGCVNYALLNVTLTSAPPIIIGDLGFISFCPNSNALVPFSTSLPSGTQMDVYLSDALGNFTEQVLIGRGTFSPINVRFPLYMIPSAKYRIKITTTTVVSNFSSNLSTTGERLWMDVKTQNGRSYTNIDFNYYYGQNICNGSSTTLTILPNVPDVVFEWKRNGAIVSTQPTYTINQTGTYELRVKKGACTNYSRTYDFTFVNTAVNYAQRTGQEFQCNGITSVLRSYYISDNATYQWKRDGVIIPGANKDTLATNQTGTYEVNTFDNCTFIDQSNIYKRNRLVFGNSIESSINANQTVLCGTAYSLPIYCYSNFYTNTLGRFTYQWKKNGVDIPNKINQELNVIEPGIYSLTLSQGNCSSTSSGISMTKIDTVKLGLNLQYPYSNEICQGMSVNILADNKGISPTTIFKDNSIFKNYPQSEVAVTETGNYILRSSQSIYNGCTIFPSDTLKITVGNKLKPNLDPRKTILCSTNIGDYSSVSCSSAVPANTSYQWFKGNVPVAGAIYHVLSVRQSGFYKLRVTSGVCTGFSDSVEIKLVNQLPKPVIYQMPLSSENNGTRVNSNYFICTNNLSPYFGIENIYRYRTVNYDSLLWKRNGQIIARLAFDKPIYITQPGVYTILGKQGTCETESDPVEIKIGEPITANITGSTSIYPGQKANLNLNFTGGNAWSFQISDVASGQTTSLSPTLKNVSPSSTQTYAITSVASNCGVGTVTGNATVTVLPCPTDKTISINSGNWITSTTWTCGQIPTAAYDAIIENGHTVTLPNGYQGQTKKLDLRGGLKQGVGAGLRVNQ